MDTLSNLTATLVDSQEEEDYMAWQQAVAHTATKFLSPGSIPQQKSAINDSPEESKFLVPSSSYNSSVDLSVEIRSPGTNSFSYTELKKKTSAISAGPDESKERHLTAQVSAFSNARKLNQQVKPIIIRCQGSALKLLSTNLWKSSNLGENFVQAFNPGIGHSMFTTS